MRFFSRIVLVVGLFVCLMQVQAQSSGIADLLDLVNQARITRGVSPLAPSAILTTVAQAHSDDMAKTEKLSHTGSDGSEFWQRMQTGTYNLTSGAENILFRYDTDAKSTFQQWEDSSAHLANMINPAYHEIGLAYTQADTGTYYYTMVLGARADSTPLPYVSPTLNPNASATSAARSATVIPTQALATKMPSVTPLFADAPLVPTAIQLTPLGQSVDTGAPQILLTYDDSTIILQSIGHESINVNAMTFAGPGGTFPSSSWKDVGESSLSALQTGDCLQIWRVESEYLEKPDTCRVRQAWTSTRIEGQFWRGEGTFTVQKNNRIVAECPIAAGTCQFALVKASSVQDPVSILTQASNNTDVRLFVESDGVTIMNTSGRDIDLSTLTLVGETGTFGAADWNNRQIDKPLNQFPTGMCMQVWAFAGDEDEEPAKPAECNYRIAWLLLPPEQQFWLEESFTVINKAVPVATCSTTEHICNVTLPEEQK